MENIFSKTLVTGGSGMVGSYVDFGIKTDHRSLDITDPKEVLAVCKKYMPKVILHLAAETDVDRCERDQQHAYAVNTIGTYYVAAAAKEIEAKLVYISTAGIFDGTKNAPYVEEDEPNPHNYYGRSKYLGELIVRGMLSDYLIVRAGWMFGGGPKKDQKFIAKMVEQLNKPEIRAVNDKVGSPTYAKDLVAGIYELLKENKTGIYHMGNRGSASRYEVAKLIAEVLRPSVSVLSVDSSYFKLDASRGGYEGMESKADIMRPWQDALREYLKSEWQSIQ